MANISLYFHIPFCARKCSYCGFFSQAGKSSLWQEYFDCLKIELLSYKNILKDYSIASVYFGGGTPSLVDALYIAKLLSVLASNFKLDQHIEITLEANPESLTDEKLQSYQKANINRLSIGIQSTNNKLLTKIGRQYDWQKVKKVYKNAKDAGFTNINLDLIFGFPKQSLEGFETDLQNIIELNPEHIACYSLELDAKSALGKLYALGKFQSLNENINRKMYIKARKILKMAGYIHYEISNWSKRGYKCNHNYNFWQYKPYIGIGAGAHSFWENFRWDNIESIEKYINMIKRQGTAINNKYTINKINQQKEKLMLSLRLIKGINLNSIDSVFLQKIIPKLSQLKNDGLIILSKDSFRLSVRGLDLENEIIGDLFF